MGPILDQPYGKARIRSQSPGMQDASATPTGKNPPGQK